MHEFNIGPIGNWNGSVRVITKLGNIANETVDVICVSVSDSLRHSHSVWNALTKVAGTNEYKVAFDKARESLTSWLTPGDVLAVDATTTKLAVKFVFLVVHPDIHHLDKAYRSIFHEAVARQCTSIAIPGLGCGNIGNSVSSSAVTACTAIYETATSNAFSCIQMVAFVDVKQDVVNKFAAQLHAKFVNSDTMKSMEAINSMQKFIKPLSEVVEDDCSICLSALGGGESEVFELPCAHQYHVQCFREYLDSPGHKKWCPLCRKYFELPLGDQPNEARMFINKNFSLKLPGHEDSDFTYEILYIVESGIQEASHIRPGKPFSGTRRRAYVPGTPEGTKVLRLLRFAFERRLIFTLRGRVCLMCDALAELGEEGNEDYVVGEQCASYDLHAIHIPNSITCRVTLLARGDVMGLVASLIWFLGALFYFWGLFVTSKALTYITTHYRGYDDVDPERVQFIEQMLRDLIDEIKQKELDIAAGAIIPTTEPDPEHIDEVTAKGPSE
ncbi:unnamed protein product [Angiostrongylus costaricensis]|uniref:E3 ubiquitin-protein ligase n=1 Tax=Angiostrongylus costaricensis TaxID=334426 RepID=A0A158PFR1_ANGCS|nr:unnamed protein product [Angiostrongylus costaricensis]